MTGTSVSVMNQIARLLAPALMLLSLIMMMLLTSCGGGGGGGYVNENRTLRGYNPGVGPFDNQGNYIERWANDKSKGNWWRKSIVHEPATTAPPTAKPAVVAAVATPKTSVKPTTKATASSSSPKPKPAATSASAPKPSAVVKVQPARKPPIRHVIKKGDTLWGLSRKYGTTVTAIQRANGLKGSNLSIGRTLLIPRY